MLVLECALPVPLGHMQAKPLLDRVFLLHLLYPVLSIGRYQRRLTIYIPKAAGF